MKTLDTKDSILARICMRTKAYKYSFNDESLDAFADFGIYDIKKDEFVLVFKETCNGLEYQCLTDRGFYWISTRDIEYA